MVRDRQQILFCHELCERQPQRNVHGDGEGVLHDDNIDLKLRDELFQVFSEAASQFLYGARDRRCPALSLEELYREIFGASTYAAEAAPVSLLAPVAISNQGLETVIEGLISTISKTSTSSNE